MGIWSLDKRFQGVRYRHCWGISHVAPSSYGGVGSAGSPPATRHSWDYSVGVEVNWFEGPSGFVSMVLLTDRQERSPHVCAPTDQLGVAAGRLMATGDAGMVGSAGRLARPADASTPGPVASAPPSWRPPGQVATMSTASRCEECGTVASVVTRHRTLCARCALAAVPSTEATVTADEKGEPSAIASL